MEENDFNLVIRLLICLRKILIFKFTFWLYSVSKNKKLHFQYQLTLSTCAFLYKDVFMKIILVLSPSDRGFELCKISIGLTGVYKLNRVY